MTSGPWWDSGPRWSPDGRTIAFASDRDGDDELYLMNADGSDVRQLTHNHVEDTAPSWSSDGRRLALTSDRGGSQAIWTINSDGSGARRFPSAGTVAGTSPVWSPDGRWIAYGRVDEHSAWTATTVIADARTGATGCTAGGIPFAWSPDSRQLQLRPNQLGEAATVDACRPGPVSTPSVAPFLWAPDGAGTIACAPFSTADGCDADWQPLPTTTSVR